MPPISLPWRRNRPMVDYLREGGTPPPDHENLVVDSDGTFQLWRTIDRAATPPTPVGRFAGELDDGQRLALRTAVADCARARPVTISPPPGASVDKVRIGSRTAGWAEDQIPPEPWGGLATLLRELLGALTKSAEAALSLRRTASGVAVARLGDGQLELDLSRTTIQAVCWKDGAVIDRWTAAADGPWSVQTGPGWEFALPFDHPFGADAEVTALVDDLLAFDGHYWRACSLAG
jgi:hypothetical protein